MKPKLVVLTNLISPYRAPIYRAFGESFDVLVATGKPEPNRKDWGAIHEKLANDNVRVEVAAGKMFVTSEATYLHVEPGYLSILFREKPDAVISIEIGFRTLFALVYTVLKRKPLWVWWGGTLHSERNIGAAKRTIRRIFAKLGIRWISYGQESTRYLESIGVSKERIVQIQNAVDESLFTNEGPIAARDVNGPPLLLVVGQLIGRKGLEPLLRSLHRLQLDGEKFVLRLVGSGPRREALEEQVAETGLKGIEFIGGIPPDQLPAQYRAADVLVFPTLEDNWGLAVNEALLCGTPVISSKYAGCSSELLEAENIFDPNVDADIDRALKRAIHGEVKMPRESNMWPIAQVSGVITKDILTILNPAHSSAGKSEPQIGSSAERSQEPIAQPLVEAVPRKKIAILTNFVSPYRVPMFVGLGSKFNVVIAVGKREQNYLDWKSPESTLKAKGVELQEVKGWVFHVSEARSVHINPGYFSFLFKQRPDGIISGEMGFRTLCAAIFSRMTGTPFWIWSECTQFSERNAGSAKMFLRRRLVRTSARWISFGDACTEYLLSLGVARTAIVQIQNGVDDSLFHPNGEKESFFGPRPLLLVVGRLLKQKGLDPLMESVQRIQCLGHVFSLRFVGSGPQRQSLEETAKRLSIQNVEFKGALPPEALPTQYRTADVLVFPTLQDVWGLVTNEAILCGTPVVCSKYAGCASEIVPAEDIFDPLVPEDFDRALLRAVTGKVCPPDTQRVWPMERIVGELMDDLESVLSPPAP